MTELIGADLFAGLGGFTEGAEQAGARVAWAGNHWRFAVDTHALNHPSTLHVCQDLHQACWPEVREVLHGARPAKARKYVDFVLAGPSCVGHSQAGQHARTGYTERAKVKHDIDRATAWAVVSCLEVCRPLWSVTENVPRWPSWELFPHWLGAVQTLGYHTCVMQLGAHQFGAPQARERVFVLACRDAKLLARAADYIEAQRRPEAEALGVDSFAQWDAGEWRDIELAGHTGQRETSRDRLRASLRLAKQGHERWWCQHVTGHHGRLASVPLSTLTGADQHVLVKSDGLGGAVYRTLLPTELLAVQGFPSTYKIPTCTRRDLVRAVGNAVAVPLAKTIVQAMKEAA